MTNDISTVEGLIKMLQEAVLKDPNIKKYQIQIQEESNQDINGDIKDNCYLEDPTDVMLVPHPSPATEKEKATGVIVLRGWA